MCLFSIEYHMLYSFTRSKWQVNSGSFFVQNICMYTLVFLEFNATLKDCNLVVICPCTFCISVYSCTIGYQSLEKMAKPFIFKVIIIFRCILWLACFFFIHGWEWSSIQTRQHYENPNLLCSLRATQFFILFRQYNICFTRIESEII